MNRSNILVTLAIVGGAVAASLATFGAVGACNSGNGDCPDKAAVVPGESCSDEHLQCAFDLTTPAVACDGTSSVIATSCTCTHGAWDCPSAIECEAGAEDAEAEGGYEAGDDGGSNEASAEEAGGDAGDAGDAGD